MHARLREPNNLLYSVEPDFHCLADEIAEPRPDMNIRVDAFTISEKVYKYINEDNSRHYQYYSKTTCNIQIKGNVSKMIEGFHLNVTLTLANELEGYESNPGCCNPQ